MNDEALESATTTSVGRGLYLLRYVSGAVSGRSPVAIVRPAPGSEPFIEVISAPGVVSGFLARPGDCLVVRAEQPGSLSVKLIRQNSGESIDATLRLEPIAVDASVAPTPARAVEPAPLRREAESGIQLRLCGHVARRGDVEVSAAQWVAGPGAPAAIEGIEIRGAFPAGVRIETQALVATNPPRWLDWASAGAFAGTRGRAMPLAGLRLRLAGEAASRYVLRADALFLGSAIVTRRGREVELVGSGAADPLVGFRLDIEPASPVVADSAPPLSAGAANSAVTEKQAASRVRVFRSSSHA
ncbi:hypothetical protein QM467_18490 [Rhodoblastus sp. 17X3]|uniref:hypothetical protein n=1 Tax=Rhodoblastus sp. 17X3 TaxID=3047026 RepID=UPI0024B654C6|nr:hypothetical protein [Rhodoblastus sp. 17X3]MDI9850030.1 hypothetical protein [Rhodoblastus sp. 17X3]